MDKNKNLFLKQLDAMNVYLFSKWCGFRYIDECEKNVEIKNQNKSNEMQGIAKEWKTENYIHKKTKRKENMTQVEILISLALLQSMLLCTSNVVAINRICYVVV